MSEYDDKEVLCPTCKIPVITTIEGELVCEKCRALVVHISELTVISCEVCGERKKLKCRQNKANLKEYSIECLSCGHLKTSYPVV
jgi:hypothetical protein